MKVFQKFLCCLELEWAVVGAVLFDTFHFLWHFMVFLPLESGRRAYIFHRGFELDADLFLFY